MNDKTLLKNRFAANLSSYNSLAVVQESICDELSGMIGRFGPKQIASGLEIGTGTGFLTRRLLQLYPAADWTLNDLVEESECFLHPYTQNIRIRYEWGDAESLPDPNGPFDLIATASTVQWFDDLPAFAARAKAMLASGGTLAMSTFGPDNFREIKATTGDGLSYYTSDELSALLHRAGLTIIEQHAYTRQLTFGTPTDVLRHIKATGVNAIHKTHWTKRRLTDFEAQYREQFSTPDREVTLTYHPILIIAQKPE